MESIEAAMELITVAQEDSKLLGGDNEQLETIRCFFRRVFVGYFVRLFDVRTIQLQAVQLPTKHNASLAVLLRRY